MYSFFVLGIVPGTNITISFTMWMQFFAACAGLAALYAVHRSSAGHDSELPPTIGHELASS